MENTPGEPDPHPANAVIDSPIPGSSAQTWLTRIAVKYLAVTTAMPWPWRLPYVWWGNRQQATDTAARVDATQEPSDDPLDSVDRPSITTIAIITLSISALTALLYLSCLSWFTQEQQLAINSVAWFGVGSASLSDDVFA